MGREVTLSGRQLLTAALACLGAALLVVALWGCSTDPQDGSGAACGRQALPGAQPPPADQVKAAMEEGWSQAVETCPQAAGDTFRPAVVWKTSDFWVASGYDTPGGAAGAHGICASGCPWLAAGEIWISLAEPWRVLSLVTWESRNMAWLRNHCEGQAYRHAPPGAI